MRLSVSKAVAGVIVVAVVPVAVILAARMARPAGYRSTWGHSGVETSPVNKPKLEKLALREASPLVLDGNHLAESFSPSTRLQSSTVQTIYRSRPWFALEHPADWSSEGERTIALASPSQWTGYGPVTDTLAILNVHRASSDAFDTAIPSGATGVITQSIWLDGFPATRVSYTDEAGDYNVVVDIQTTQLTAPGAFYHLIGIVADPSTGFGPEAQALKIALLAAVDSIRFIPDVVYGQSWPDTALADPALSSADSLGVLHPTGWTVSEARGAFQIDGLQDSVYSAGPVQVRLLPYPGGGSDAWENAMTLQPPARMFDHPARAVDTWGNLSGGRQFVIRPDYTVDVWLIETSMPVFSDDDWSDIRWLYDQTLWRVLTASDLGVPQPAYPPYP
jgi:hypothetical protein